MHTAATTHLEVLVTLPVAGNDVVTLRLQALGKVGCNEASSTSDTYPQLGGPVCLKGKFGKPRDFLRSCRVVLCLVGI